jgi:hypothetical protein
VRRSSIIFVPTEFLLHNFNMLKTTVMLTKQNLCIILISAKKSAYLFVCFSHISTPLYTYFDHIYVYHNSGGDFCRLYFRHLKASENFVNPKRNKFTYCSRTILPSLLKILFCCNPYSLEKRMPPSLYVKKVR